MIEWYTRPLQLQPGLGPQPRPVQPRLAIVDVPLDGPGVDLQAHLVSSWSKMRSGTSFVLLSQQAQRQAAVITAATKDIQV